MRKINSFHITPQYLCGQLHRTNCWDKKPGDGAKSRKRITQLAKMPQLRLAPHIYQFSHTTSCFSAFPLFPENRCIELHSPDGIHSCILRAMDPQEATTWFNALHSAIGKSTQKALLDANRALVSIIGELKHIGWLSRRSGGEQVSTHTHTGAQRKLAPTHRHSLLWCAWWVGYQYSSWPCVAQHSAAHTAPLLGWSAVEDVLFTLVDLCLFRTDLR